MSGSQISLQSPRLRLFHQKAIARMLIRQMPRDGPIHSFVAALIAQAITDLALPKQRASALKFLSGKEGERWCELSGLEQHAVRDIAKLWQKSLKTKHKKKH